MYFRISGCFDKISFFFKNSVALAVFNILLPVEQFLARTAEQFEAWLLNSIDTVQ